ncbi:MAG: ABC transporter ATP-binding protein/permease [Flavobacteriaceae bacterium]|nr:ABC transporter ATP-binding protein/permease [Flavobacteriaceae bacterium]
MLSIFDIFSLLLLLPIIKIILDPTIIYKNQYLLFLFSEFGFNSEVVFAIFLLFIIVLFFVVKNVVTYYGIKWQSNTIFNIAEKLTIHQFKLYLFKPFQYYTNNETGNLLRSIIEVPFNFASGILFPLVIIINELIVVLIILVVITIYNPYLFISVILFTAPFLIIYTFFQKNRLKKVSKERDINHANMFAKGKQALDGFKEVILFDKIDFFKVSFQKSVNKFSSAFSTLYLYNSYSPRLVEGIAVLSIFSVIVTGYALNYDMKLIASFLVAFSLAAYRLIPSINKVILSYNNIKSSEFVFSHFEQSQELSESFNIVKSNSVFESSSSLKFSSGLEIKNLSFNYNDSKENIFNKLNIKISKGETVGIIGDSGSGKTTLINILLLLLDEFSGEILVDGQKLDSKSKKEWHKTISYVPQNVIIIAGTLLENITFGIPFQEVNHSKLEKVIEQSQLQEFIQRLPNGINTEIGEHGLKISGGQRQRIGIARALYHEGSLLIFDEATSSLDNKTEMQLTNSIRNLSGKEFTIIIIAHRLESLRYCDSIYKIENGKTVGPLVFEDIK